MSTDPDKTLENCEEQMKRSMEHALHEFSTLHTGKASPSMVEGIQIEAYGSTMKIRDVAAITTPDNRTISIQPWDKTVMSDVKKGIEKANLGFNPSVDSNVIRINIPELSKERRQELVRLCHNMAEEGRVGIRAARQEAMTELKKAKDAKELSEDDLKVYEKEVQKLTDQYTSDLTAQVERKEKELIQI